MASIVGENNAQWRTYVHYHHDNSIHELILPNVNSLNYTDNILSFGPTPCHTSPVAAVGWGDLSDIRVYYFTNESTVQELVWSTSGGWSVGMNLGDTITNGISLYAQVRATGTDLAELRVGYQSPSDPETITESYYIPTEEKWGTRTYPNEMD